MMVKPERNIIAKAQLTEDYAFSISFHYFHCYLGINRKCISSNDVTMKNYSNFPF